MLSAGLADRSPLRSRWVKSHPSSLRSFGGILLDRFGPRRTVLPSAIGLGIGTGLLSLLTPHLWHFYLMFGVIVFVAGAASPLGYAGVLVRRFDKKLGLALGIALMGSGLGAAVLPSLSQVLIAHLGWRMAYAGLGGLAILVAGPAAFIATRNTRGPLVRTAGVVAVPVFPFLRTRAFILICSTFFLLATASVGSITHFVPMMTDRGFSLAVAARVAGLIGVSTLVSRGVAGWLLDRLHAPYLLAFVASMCSVSSLVLAYAVKLPSFAAQPSSWVWSAARKWISFHFSSGVTSGRRLSAAYTAWPSPPSCWARVLCSSATATIASISTASDFSFALRFRLSLRLWPWRCRDTKSERMNITSWRQTP